MKAISKTLFVPLYFKYLESMSDKNIYDNEAVYFFEKVGIDNIDFNSFKNDVNTYTGTIARTLLIDRYLLSSINLFKNMDFNIINIACGLDFRNRRLGLNSVPNINIDLQDVIELREKYFPAHKNEHNKVGDITDIKNWNFIPKGNNIFILEGILMYFSKKNVIEIFRTLKKKSDNSLFIFEVLPEMSPDVKHPTISKISKNLDVKWGCNNIEDFIRELGFECLDSEMTISLLKERWNFKILNSVLGNAEKFLRNHKIVWMKG